MMSTKGTIMRRAVLATGVVAGAMALGACGPRYAAYDVSVSLDPAMARDGRYPAVEVDLIAVSSSERDRWVSKPVSEYFSGNDPFRRDASKKTMQFSTDNPGPIVLSRRDPMWQTWKGRQELFILANLGGVSGTGASDPRRLVLSLDTRRWPGDRKLEILVQSSKVTCLTPERAVKD